MADSQFVTLEGALTKATAMKTAFAASKLRLCQAPFVPTMFSTKAELVAAEANYSGYPAGGYALATWTGPLKDPSGGAVITSPLVNIIMVDPDPDPLVPNTISAWWIEDATGNVRIVGTYEEPRTLGSLTDGWPQVVQDVEGRNATVVAA